MAVQYVGLPSAQRSDFVAVVFNSFGQSQGEDEGKLISSLTEQLLTRTPKEDLHAFCAVDSGTLIAAVIFSRIRFGNDPRIVHLLSPMAVAPDRQRQGVGSALIRFGLETLQSFGTDIALTYGDPAYYGRFGFLQTTPQIAPPPQGLTLSFPHGWRALSLTQAPVTKLPGPSRCVTALHDQAYW